MHKKKKVKKMTYLIFPFLFLSYLVTLYFIKNILYYDSSKSITRYIVIGGIVLSVVVALLITIKGLKAIAKNKKGKYISFFIISILILGLEVFGTYNINKISNSLSKITDNFINYSTSLIVLKESNINRTEDLINHKIGIISDENNIEGYIISKEIIEDEKIDSECLEFYDDFETMLNDLYEEKIDAAFVSSSYSVLFSNSGFENIKEETKIITSKDKVMKKNEKTNTKTLTEPFTVLILGVDSDSDSIKKSSSFNGDTLILMTFNPKTMNATILSIPRDTYVPISCNKYKSKNKINSAAYGGTECMIDTIEDLTNIKIDYWVKVNFKGVVDLVNALGGIEIDVPYSFCEQDSKRRFGKYMIYIDKGLQTLNGEQALAFARNRHPWPQYCPSKYSKYNSNDFIRGQNQQQIIKAVTNKLRNVNSIKEIYDLLDVIGNNIDTNIDKDTMMTGFDTFKNIIANSKNINNEDFIGMQRLYLSGYDDYINSIYYFQYYKQSLKEITDAMEINLELKEPELIKEFDYSINSPYENKQIGKGYYSK